MTTKKKESTALDERKAAALGLTEEAVVKALGIPVGLVASTSDDDVMAGILAQIAAAGSVEEALASGVTEGIADFGSQVLTFLDFRYQPSDYGEVPRWPFVVCKVAGEDGEVHTVTTGAKQIVALLALARQKGALPFAARVDLISFETEDGETRRAYKLVSP